MLLTAIVVIATAVIELTVRLVTTVVVSATAVVIFKAIIVHVESVVDLSILLVTNSRKRGRSIERHDS